MIEIEYPIKPITAIFLLPCLSEALPHDVLVMAHATAEIENIMEVSITDRPRSLANGGTNTNANDWPKPTANNPNFNQLDGLYNFCNASYLSHFLNKLLSLRTYLASTGCK